MLAAFGDCEGAQKEYLLDLLRQNRATAYGREYRFKAISSVKDFQRNVPLTKYEDYTAFVDRIAGGEEGVLTSEKVLLFQPSSGSVSARKLVPYTRMLRREFQRGILPWIFALYEEYPSLEDGRMYWSISPPGGSQGARHGTVRIGFDDDADYLGPRRRALFLLFAVAPPKIADLRDIRAFRNTTLAALLAAPDLALISVWSPSFLTLLLDWYLDYADEVLDTLRQTYPAVTRRRVETLQALGRYPSVFEQIWPHVAVISCWTDAASASEARRLQEFFPHTPIQGKGLLATEACVSLPFAPRRDPVLAVRSHFFEFLADNGDCLAAHEVAAGDEYSVVVTTGGGFYRYRLEDRVLVTGFLGTTPTLRFLGKANHISDRYGEKLHARHVECLLDNLLAGVPRRFCLLAPDQGKDGPCYTLHIELSGELPADLAHRLEHGLRENPHYCLCAGLGQLRPVRLFRVRRNGLRSYEARLVAQGQRQGDIKPACLSALDGWSGYFEGEYCPEDSA
jgi:hypothetical protein